MEIRFEECDFKLDPVVFTVNCAWTRNDSVLLTAKKQKQN